MTYTIPSEQILHEKERLRVLDSYGMLDTESEQEFDDITTLASLICKTKVSLIALMDRKRNWYKSTHGDVGFTEREMPREYSFCRITIQDDKLFEITDTTQDSRFKDNPVVVAHPYVRYYAGYPLINSEGYKLGTLCIVDTVPKKLNSIQRKALKVFADHVMSGFELRRKKHELEIQARELLKANAKLEQFAHIISHDLKEPLKNTSSLLKLSDLDGEHQLEYKEKINVNLDRMESLINGLLTFSQNNENSLKREKVDIYQLIEHLSEGLTFGKDVELDIDKNLPIIETEKVLLGQVFQNLISNAAKYNDKTVIKISVTHGFDDGEILFSVADNGPGIPHDKKEEIFEPFVRIERTKNISGVGIGLTISKKLIEERKGKIWIENNNEGAATFNFTWKP